MIALNVLDKDGNIVPLKTVDGSVLEQVVAAPTLANNNFAAPVPAFNAKAAAGKLLALHATNANAALRYLQVHNLATAPAAGAVPLYSFPIAAGSATVPGSVEKSESFFGLGGVSLGTGISIAVSTTLATYTAATGTDHVVHAHYV